MPGISRWSPGILPVYEHFHNYFHYIRKKLIPLALKSQGDFSQIRFPFTPLTKFKKFLIGKLFFLKCRSIPLNLPSLSLIIIVGGENNA